MARFNASPINTNWQNLTVSEREELEKVNIDQKVWDSWNSAAKSTTSSAANSTTDFNKGQSELTGTISKNLSLWTDLADSIRGAEGAQETLTSLTNIAVASLEKEQTIRKSIVQDLGQVGQLQQMQNETIMQASIEAQRYGVSLDELLVFANNKDKSWYKSKLTGHELGSIRPMDIDSWLSKNGLKRRPIYWS